MKKISIFIFTLFLVVTKGSFSFADYSPSDLPVEVEADSLQYMQAENKVFAKDNVYIVYNKRVYISSDEAVYDTLNNEVILKGNVKIEEGDQVIESENAVYNFSKDRGSLKELGFVNEVIPLYGKADQGGRVGDNRYDFNRGCFTTCGPVDDKQHFFDYKITAKRFSIFPNDKVVARNAVMWIQKVPVLFIPFYMQPIGDNKPHVRIIPGKSKEWGYFVLTAWRYQWQNFSGRVNIDYRERKGYGFGLKNNYGFDKLGKGLLRLYYVPERDAFYNNPGDTNYRDDNFEEDKYKVQLRHINEMSETETVRLEYHYFSDQYFNKDYFPREYEKDTAPLSFFLFQKQFNNSSLDFLAQKRVNRYYTQTEYLPEIQWDIYTLQLGQSDFYLDARYSLGNLTAKTAAPSSIDSDVNRLATDQRLTFNKQFFTYFRLAPYVNLKQLYYSKDVNGDAHRFRGAFGTGFELSSKLYRVFDFKGKPLGLQIDRLRHVVRPAINYSYIHLPTINNSKIMQFDSKDSIVRENRITPKLENILQTKRDGEVYDLASFNIEADYLFKQEGGCSFWDEGRVEFNFNPYTHAQFKSEQIFDIQEEFLQEWHNDLQYIGKDWKIILGHLYLHKESNLIILDFETRLTNSWYAKLHHEYEKWGGKHVLRQYQLTKELNCWFVDFIFDIDQHHDYTFWVGFRLKAFPENGFHFRKSYDEPTLENKFRRYRL